MNRKERRAARSRGQAAGAGAGPSSGSAHAAVLYTEAVRLHQAGRLVEAAGLCREVLAVAPDHLGAPHLLGQIAHQTGRHEEAATHFGRVIERQPGIAAVHISLGNSLAVLGRLTEAASAFERALALKPEQPGAVEFARIFLSLANLSKDRGNFDDAARLYRRALALAPDHAQAHNDFGAMLLAQGALGEAAEQLARALALAPELLERYADLCATLFKVNPALKDAATRADAAWPARPPLAHLLGPRGFAMVARDSMLARMLVSAPVRDLELERLLTALRQALLELADDSDESGDVATFAAALARQCFINEYVFGLAPDEAERVAMLSDRLSSALAANAPIPALWLAVLGCYRPLGTLADSERLLQRQWPGEVNALLAQQVTEPRQERELSAAIPRLTAIEDESSLKVQQQYEENPYPRWVLAPSRIAAVTLEDDIRKRFPDAAWRGRSGQGALDILVAGCGTGQHSIGIAGRYRDARVLAVDLSLASLSYALRKTQEFGGRNIEYAQADILKLESLERRFDLIDAGGVLHHLADPLAGWRVLRTLLKPGGLMRIGLYSEIGRRDIAAARAFIAARGYQPSASEIRRCRQELMQTEFARLKRFQDFFSMSECRDLLFHVQEHRLRLPTIRALLDALQLRFLGFELDASVVRAYRLRFPESREMTNLDGWDRFENDHPDTFAAMYQFWAAAA